MVGLSSLLRHILEIMIASITYFLIIFLNLSSFNRRYMTFCMISNFPNIEILCLAKKKIFRILLDFEIRMLYCRCLATGDSYHSLHYNHMIGTSTISSIIPETCDAIWQALQPEHMKHPTKERWRAIANGFGKRWNFPNCVGTLDGKHVLLQCPANTGSMFYNYKGTYSIVLLALTISGVLFHCHWCRCLFLHPLHLARHCKSQRTKCSIEMNMVHQCHTSQWWWSFKISFEDLYDRGHSPADRAWILMKSSAFITANVKSTQIRYTTVQSEKLRETPSVNSPQSIILLNYITIQSSSKIGHTALELHWPSNLGTRQTLSSKKCFQNG